MEKYYYQVKAMLHVEDASTWIANAIWLIDQYGVGVKYYFDVPPCVAREFNLPKADQYSVSPVGCDDTKYRYHIAFVPEYREVYENGEEQWFSSPAIIVELREEEDERR